MSRKPLAAPGNTRNGLKWRDGRPRWEPSPASRKAGLSGVDLRAAGGAWLSRGEAIDICDGRTLWAQGIREALAGGVAGADALADLSVALDGLRPPTDDFSRLRRSLVADLIDRARAVVEARPDASPIRGAGPRTVRAMTEGYLADERILRRLTPSTLKAYTGQAKRLNARFGNTPVAQLTRRQLVDWYEDALLDELTVATANQCMGATAAFLAWAFDQEWIPASPAVKLGLRSAGGRLVFWTFEHERAFVAWCDGAGFEDVADGVAAGLWTGARIGDICLADLADMAGAAWRFTPQKTVRKGQEAMPAIMPALRSRLDRRAAAALKDTVRHLAGTPFLWDFRTNRRHDTKSFYYRFKAAKALFLATPEAPADFAGLRVQDTRDTCITRLFLADVAPARMWTWTGHSQKSIEKILRDHYLVLREEGALELAGKLTAWADKQGVAIA